MGGSWLKSSAAFRARGGSGDLDGDGVADFAFKRFLAHNPKAKIIWSHVGFEPLLNRQPKRVAALLEAYPNLYMSFRLNRSSPNPAAAIDPDGKLKPQWLELIQRYPERFMLGSDSFYDRTGISRGSGEEGLSNLRTLIESLPEPTRTAVRCPHLPSRLKASF